MAELTPDQIQSDLQSLAERQAHLEGSLESLTSSVAGLTETQKTQTNQLGQIMAAITGLTTSVQGIKDSITTSKGTVDFKNIFVVGGFVLTVVLAIGSFFIAPVQVENSLRAEFARELALIAKEDRKETDTDLKNHIATEGHPGAMTAIAKHDERFSRVFSDISNLQTQITGLETTLQREMHLLDIILQREMALRDEAVKARIETMSQVLTALSEAFHEERDKTFSLEDADRMERLILERIRHLETQP